MNGKVLIREMGEMQMNSEVLIRKMGRKADER